MSTLERLARVLAVADAEFWGAEPDPSSWPSYVKSIRAILTALREPGAETVDAMRLCTIRNSRPVDPSRPFESPFTAAIDHILADSPTP